MEQRRVPVRYPYPGPLPERGMPGEVLYDVRLTLRQESTDPAILKRALQRLGGDLRLHRVPWLGVRLRSRGGRVSYRGWAKEGRLTLRLDQRVKGRSLDRIAAALATLPGATDLVIDATTPRFAAPYSGVGPCTPCAAKGYPMRTRR